MEEFPIYLQMITAEQIEDIRMTGPRQSLALQLCPPMLRHGCVNFFSEFFKLLTEPQPITERETDRSVGESPLRLSYLNLVHLRNVYTVIERGIITQQPGWILEAAVAGASTLSSLDRPSGLPPPVITTALTPLTTRRVRAHWGVLPRAHGTHHLHVRLASLAYHAVHATPAQLRPLVEAVAFRTLATALAAAGEPALGAAAAGAAALVLGELGLTSEAHLTTGITVGPETHREMHAMFIGHMELAVMGLGASSENAVAAPGVAGLAEQLDVLTSEPVLAEIDLRRQILASIAVLLADESDLQVPAICGTKGLLFPQNNDQTTSNDDLTSETIDFISLASNVTPGPHTEDDPALARALALGTAQPSRDMLIRRACAHYVRIAELLVEIERPSYARAAAAAALVLAASVGCSTTAASALLAAAKTLDDTDKRVKVLEVAYKLALADPSASTLSAAAAAALALTLSAQGRRSDAETLFVENFYLTFESVPAPGCWAEHQLRTAVARFRAAAARAGAAAPAAVAAAAAAVNVGGLDVY